MSFCLFILFIGFSWQEFWNGLLSLPPVDQVLCQTSPLDLSIWVCHVSHDSPLQGCDPWRGRWTLSAIWWYSDDSKYSWELSAHYVINNFGSSWFGMSETFSFWLVHRYDGTFVSHHTWPYSVLLGPGKLTFLCFTLDPRGLIISFCMYSIGRRDVNWPKGSRKSE